MNLGSYVDSAIASDTSATTCASGINSIIKFL
ncbi:hypothetical protein Nos7524_2011 [Nostoc sp. PCC 7524]|nr:hypothetical protein Nos7524_2011 [Nostoc sp. PCC 7524]